MIYKVESAIKDWYNVTRMAAMCWEEVDQMKGSLSFELDKEKYQQIEEQGMLRYYTLSTDEGKKVGFAAFIINPSLHCKGKFLAISDCMYIEPAYRKHGTKLLQMVQQDLKEEGVHWFSFNVKAWLDNGRLAEKLGCEKYEHVYQRVL